MHVVRLGSFVAATGFLNENSHYCEGAFPSLCRSLVVTYVSKTLAIPPHWCSGLSFCSPSFPLSTLNSSAAAGPTRGISKDLGCLLSFDPCTHPSQVFHINPTSESSNPAPTSAVTGSNIELRSVSSASDPMESAGSIGDPFGKIADPKSTAKSLHLKTKEGM